MKSYEFDAVAPLDELSHNLGYIAGIFYEQAGRPIPIQCAGYAGFIATEVAKAAVDVVRIVEVPALYKPAALLYTIFGNLRGF